jgi:dolichol-phosphate mannosyltransferase
MTEDVAAVRTPIGRRLRIGISRPANWAQLVRFLAVGGSGVAVNLAVFWLLVTPLDVDYRVAAAVSFTVALANNFWWNRHWTFAAADGHAGFQAARFLVVSLGAFTVNLIVLELIVQTTSAPEVLAQACAIAVATPVNFLGNKLWSFAS